MEVDTVESADHTGESELMEGSVGSGDGNSSDDSSDAEDFATAARLEAEVEELPLYETYSQLIDIYKSLGELQKLRDARQRLSEHFALHQGVWLDWIGDEKELVSTAEDKQKLLELFDRAVQDFLSVELWIEYGSYTMGALDPTECREVMSRAIDNAGYHTTEGKLVWDLKIEYETALLHTMQPAVGACPSSEEQTLISEQTERVDSLYRQLIVTPVVGIQSAVVEYEQWLGETISSELKEAHNKAVDILNSCSRHENELASAQMHPEKIEAYESYITSYMTHHSELTSCIRCLFERALAEDCEDVSLWVRYTTYMAKVKDSPDSILTVYRRSLRSCPLSSALWVAYTLLCEKQGEPFETLEGHLETALHIGMLNSQDFLSMYTTYCDVIRRKICWTEIDQELLEKLRAVFDRAIHHLLKCYGEDGDEDCLLPKYWALIEAKHCSNKEKAREIWNDMMAGWRRDKASAWLEYITFERCYGDHKHCRRVFQRALKAVTDWPESICSEYVRFEREEGTLDHLYVAQSRVADVRLRIAEEEKKRKPRFDNKKPFHKDKFNKKPFNKDQKAFKKDKFNPKQDKKEHKADKTSEGANREQRKPANANKEPVVYKRKRDQQVQDTAASSSEQVSAPEGEFKQPAPRPGEEFKAPSTQDQPPSKRAKTTETEGRTDYSSTDNTTVFVSNLAFTTTELHLKDKFSQCGHVKDVRVMKRGGDKSKGYAYVEFASVDSVASALQLDRAAIEGRPMYVSPCNRKRTDQPKLKYDTGMEKCKLFVSGLSYSLSKEQVELEFAKHGKVKDVRIVTFKGGKSKGLAYVEFYNENDARQALLALDNTELAKHTITVAISNPPPRRPPTSDNQFVPSLGGASRQIASSAPRGRARTQLNLMPRVMQKKLDAPKPAAIKKTSGTADTTTTASSAQTEEPAGMKSKQKLSNADFRTLLLSKK